MEERRVLATIELAEGVAEVVKTADFGGIVMAVVLNGEIIGRAQTRPFPEHVEMFDIFVERPFRQRGIANRLYDVAAEYHGMKVEPSHAATRITVERWARRGKVMPAGCKINETYEEFGDRSVTFTSHGDEC